MTSLFFRVFCCSLIGFLCLGSSAQLITGEFNDLYSHFIHNNELQPCSVDLEGALAQEGVYSINPIIKGYYDDPYAIPTFLANISEMMLLKHTTMLERSQYAFRLMGAPAGGIGPPLAGHASIIQPCSSETELEDAIDDLISAQIILEDIKENNTWKNIGFNDQNLFIYLIRVIDEANLLYMEYERSVLGNLYEEYETGENIRNMLMQPIYKREMCDFSSIAFYEDADLRKLSYASRVLMGHMRTARRMIHDCDNTKKRMDFQCSTKYGRVGFFGPDDDIVTGSFALTIDLGGDDEYYGNIACTQAAISKVGIHIDLDGDDTYHPGNGYSVCRADLGAAVLIDLGGNDSYEVSSSGLASSCFGFSYLFDLAGDDRYKANENFSIASAIEGVAFLQDNGGDDVYLSGSYSQGFAGPGGIGMLLDHQGNDQYDSYDDGEISFVQGSSKGRWAEASDGHSLTGGCGFLIDGSGNDAYSASSFAQGASYYFGAGFLSDLGGDDTYNAVSHSQAYGVHYSLACMIEANGNDQYNAQADPARITQIIASGRDHSAGILIELKGKDTYRFGNRSLGISDMEGIGIFIDFEGEDSFKHIPNSIYSASGYGGKMFKAEGMLKRFSIIPLKTKSAGVFMDMD